LRSRDRLITVFRIHFRTHILNIRYALSMNYFLYYKYNMKTLKRNFHFFAISKTIAVIIGLYLLHTNASEKTIKTLIIINILQLMILLSTTGEYWLMTCASLSMLDPTNYTLHAISILPSYLFSVNFTSRIAMLSLLLIPLSLYKFGWRAQYMSRGWLIITLGGCLMFKLCKRCLPKALT
jgi:hypothetical protein